jgi:DNA-directed RNA polymerase specialized sigma subunit
MNKRELSKYYYITLEIRELEERIAVVENTIVGSSKLTGMPRGSGKSDPVNKTTELLITLKSKLEKRKAEAMTKLIQIEEYISEIEDSEVRLIFSKRYIELKKWEQIADELYMSLSTVHRKHSNYLGRNNHDRKY